MDSCFVDQVIEPVQLLDVGPDSHQQCHVANVDDLTAYFANQQNSNYTCRYMFVMLRTSQSISDNSYAFASANMPQIGLSTQLVSAIADHQVDARSHCFPP
jgi:hypothetical protein